MTHINSCDEAVGHEATGSLAEPSEPTASATTEEPTIEFIHQLAQHGLSQYGHHGAMTSMGLPRAKLPYFDDMAIHNGSTGEQTTHGRAHGGHTTCYWSGRQQTTGIRYSFICC